MSELSRAQRAVLPAKNGTGPRSASRQWTPTSRPADRGGSASCWGQRPATLPDPTSDGLRNGEGQLQPKHLRELHGVLKAHPDVTREDAPHTLVGQPVVLATELGDGPGITDGNGRSEPLGRLMLQLRGEQRGLAPTLGHYPVLGLRSSERVDDGAPSGRGGSQLDIGRWRELPGHRTTVGRRRRLSPVMDVLVPVSCVTCTIYGRAATAVPPVMSITGVRPLLEGKS